MSASYDPTQDLLRMRSLLRWILESWGDGRLHDWEWRQDICEFCRAHCDDAAWIPHAPDCLYNQVRVVLGLADPRPGPAEYIETWQAEIDSINADHGGEPTASGRKYLAILEAKIAAARAGDLDVEIPVLAGKRR